MNSLSSALTAMRRSPYQTLSAILLVTITFFVGYAFSLFSLGSEYILRYFETRPQVIAFFELNASTSQINTLAEQMRQQPYVENVSIVSKEQALELYRQDNAEDPLLLELVSADILPASIEVRGRTVDDLPTIKAELDGVEGIDEVVYQQDLVESLAGWTTSIRWLGIGSLSLLGVTSFLIIMVIIGMKVATKRPAITIMRIIGATRWYIRSPFLAEGVLYGLIGSLLGWGAMYVGLLYLTPWLKEFLGPIQLLPVRPEIFALQLGIGTLIAIFLGGFAAAVAVGRMIKR
jgi:cell division transport system permease protein